MNEQTTAPLIIGFVADFMFTTRIENAAKAAGFRVHWLERASDVGQVNTTPSPETPGESLHGRLGHLFTQLANWQPALLPLRSQQQGHPLAEMDSSSQILTSHAPDAHHVLRPT